MPSSRSLRTCSIDLELGFIICFSTRTENVECVGFLCRKDEQELEQKYQK